MDSLGSTATHSLDSSVPLASLDPHIKVYTKHIAVFFPIGGWQWIHTQELHGMYYMILYITRHRSYLRKWDMTPCTKNRYEDDPFSKVRVPGRLQVYNT